VTRRWPCPRGSTPTSAPATAATPEHFLAAYRAALATSGEPGHIALPTASHDFARLHTAPRAPEQLPPAFAFLLTFPALPAIYHGEEIGMRYVPVMRPGDIR
jgi:maltose alpha-D-glucosyltransferase/alpha-amylase